MWSRAERLLAEWLSKYLGAYIRDLARQRLKVGIWRGHLELEGFELTAGALAALGLPVSVARSRVRRLQLSLPWTRLFSDPLELEVEGVDVVLRLKEPGELDGRARARAARAQRRMALDALEVLRLGARAGGPGPQAGREGASRDTSVLGQLGAHLLGRVRVVLRDVCVRAEWPPDPGPGPGPCAGGAGGGGGAGPGAAQVAAGVRWSLLRFGPAPPGPAAKAAEAAVAAAGGVEASRHLALEGLQAFGGRRRRPGLRAAVASPRPPPPRPRRPHAAGRPGRGLGPPTGRGPSRRIARRRPRA